jgi:hypothetical protein
MIEKHHSLLQSFCLRSEREKGVINSLRFFATEATEANNINPHFWSGQQPQSVIMMPTSNMPLHRVVLGKFFFFLPLAFSKASSSSSLGSGVCLQIGAVITCPCVHPLLSMCVWWVTKATGRCVVAAHTRQFGFHIFNTLGPMGRILGLLEHRKKDMKGKCPIWGRGRNERSIFAPLS